MKVVSLPSHPQMPPPEAVGLASTQAGRTEEFTVPSRAPAGPQKFGTLSDSGPRPLRTFPQRPRRECPHPEDPASRVNPQMLLKEPQPAWAIPLRPQPKPLEALRTSSPAQYLLTQTPQVPRRREHERRVSGCAGPSTGLEALQPERGSATERRGEGAGQLDIRSSPRGVESTVCQVWTLSGFSF